MLQLLPHSI